MPLTDLFGDDTPAPAPVTGAPRPADPLDDPFETNVPARGLTDVFGDEPQAERLARFRAESEAPAAPDPSVRDLPPSDVGFARRAANTLGVVPRGFVVGAGEMTAALSDVVGGPNIRPQVAAARQANQDIVESDSLGIPGTTLASGASEFLPAMLGSVAAPPAAPVFFGGAAAAPSYNQIREAGGSRPLALGGAAPAGVAGAIAPGVGGRIAGAVVPRAAQALGGGALATTAAEIGAGGLASGGTQGLLMHGGTVGGQALASSIATDPEVAARLDELVAQGMDPKAAAASLGEMALLDAVFRVPGGIGAGRARRAEMRQEAALPAAREAQRQEAEALDRRVADQELTQQQVMGQNEALARRELEAEAAAREMPAEPAPERFDTNAAIRQQRMEAEAIPPRQEVEMGQFADEMRAFEDMQAAEAKRRKVQEALAGAQQPGREITYTDPATGEARPAIRRPIVREPAGVKGFNEPAPALPEPEGLPRPVRSALADAGYTPKQLRGMTPDQAQQIIQTRGLRVKEASNVEPVRPMDAAPDSRPAPAAEAPRPQADEVRPGRQAVEDVPVRADAEARPEVRPTPEAPVKPVDEVATFGAAETRRKADEAAVAPIDAEMRRLVPESTTKMENGRIVTKSRDGRTLIDIDPAPRTQPADPQAWFASVMGGRISSPATARKVLREAFRQAQLPKAEAKFLSEKLDTADALALAWSKVSKADQQAVAERFSPNASVNLSEAGGSVRSVIALHGVLEGKIAPDRLPDVVREEVHQLAWTKATDAERRAILDVANASEKAFLKGKPMGSKAVEEVAGRIAARLLTPEERAFYKTKPGPVKDFIDRMVTTIKRWFGLANRAAPTLEPYDPYIAAIRDGSIFERPSRLRDKPAGEPGPKAETPSEAYSVETPTLRARREYAAESDTNRTTEEKRNAEAEALLADKDALAKAEARVGRGEGVSDVEVRAISMKEQEALDQALNAAEGSVKGFVAAARKFEDMRQTAMLARREAGKALQATKELGQTALSRVMDRIDVMTPWYNNRYKAAKLRGDEAAAEKVRDEAAERRAKVLLEMRDRLGIDLSDPRVREAIDSDPAYSVSVGDAAERIARRQGGLKEAWERFSAPGFAAETFAGNTLGLATPALQAAGAVIYAGKSGVRAGVNATFGRYLRSLDKDVVAGMGDRKQAARYLAGDIAEGVRHAFQSVYTGLSVAHSRITGRDTGKGPSIDEYRSQTQDMVESIMQAMGAGDRLATSAGAGARIILGAGLQATRFMDELVFTTTYRQTQRMLAAKRKGQGDSRELSEIMQDKDVMALAEKQAERVTQRRELTGSLAVIERLRSPTAGTLDHPFLGLKNIPNPLYPILPFFKSMANSTMDGVKMSPAGSVRLAVTTRPAYKTLKDPELLSRYAAERGMTMDEAKRELSETVLDSLTDSLVGATFLGLAAAFPSAFVASRGAFETAEERRTKDIAEPPARIAGVPTSRLSPAYEPGQIAAITREMAAGRMGAAEGVNAAGRALLEKQLLAPIRQLVGLNRDPETGAGMTNTEYLAQQSRNMLPFFVPVAGPPAMNWARAAINQSAQEKPTRSSDPKDYLAMGDRVPIYGAAGEEREFAGPKMTGPLGILRAGLFGSISEPGPAEQAIMQTIVKLNDAVKAEGGKPWYPSAPSSTVTGIEGRLTPKAKARRDQLQGERFANNFERLRLDENKPAKALEAIHKAHLDAAEYARRVLKREMED